MKILFALLVLLAGCATMTLETPDGCGRLVVKSTTLFGNETGTVTSGTWTVASEAGGQNAGPLIASILSGLASAGVIAAANPAPMSLRAAPPHQQVVCGTQVIPTPVPSP